MIVLKVLFWISAILIFYTFVGYPLSLMILNKIIKNKKNKVDLKLRPTVSIIIPAHNEESVIKQKIDNLASLNYPVRLI